MSFTQVRPYFRTHLDSLGYNEHRDALNFNNIAGTILDNAYHLESRGVVPQDINQSSYIFGYEVTVRVFKHVYNDPVQGLEDFEGDIDIILGELLTAQNRLSGDLLDVRPGSFLIEEYDTSNDNILMGVLTFNVLTNNCF